VEIRPKKHAGELEGRQESACSTKDETSEVGGERGRGRGRVATLAGSSSPSPSPSPSAGQQEERH